ncbi:Lrp/AsnC family transcriptional regulator [Erythrobacter alti]|uniref:Lrp/AsnC family transcriptional regulator n=1 Tax=Erythrobacter alti TaxID=1896145 RepID=UPI0030F3B2E1
MSEEITVDEIDEAIIAELRTDGRATNQQIATKLKLTAATVSTRIKRMEDANALRVVAVSDFSAHGYGLLIQVAVEVDGRPAADVAADLAELNEVFAVHLVTGRYDIDMLVALRNYDELSDFMLDRMADIGGIRSMLPAIAVDILKYKFDVAPIEAKEAS